MARVQAHASSTQTPHTDITRLALSFGKERSEAMPEKKTIAKAARDKREGKSASTQAGEFVHEQIEHIRQGKHGARSAKQAIAIGLSEARRAGVAVKTSKTASKATKKKAAQDTAAAKKRSAGTATKKSATRKRATTKALKREGTAAASKRALSAQATKSAAKRTSASKSAAAKKAAKTKGPAVRKAAAKKAARTRAKKAS
jgi:hypothetical protein